MIRPFAIGQHVWSVIGSTWTCRCGQAMTRWVDLGGREHYTPEAEPCMYRPRQRMAVERLNDEAVALHWMGRW